MGHSLEFKYDFLAGFSPPFNTMRKGRKWFNTSMDVLHGIGDPWFEFVTAEDGSAFGHAKLDNVYSGAFSHVGVLHARENHRSQNPAVLLDNLKMAYGEMTMGDPVTVLRFSEFVPVEDQISRAARFLCAAHFLMGSRTEVTFETPSRITDEARNAFIELVRAGVVFMESNGEQGHPLKFRGTLQTQRIAGQAVWEMDAMEDPHNDPDNLRLLRW